MGFRSERASGSAAAVANAVSSESRSMRFPGRQPFVDETGAVLLRREREVRLRALEQDGADDGDGAPAMTTALSVINVPHPACTPSRRSPRSTRTGSTSTRACTWRRPRAPGAGPWRRTHTAQRLGIRAAFLVVTTAPRERRRTGAAEVVPGSDAAEVPADRRDAALLEQLGCEPYVGFARGADGVERREGGARPQLPSAERVGKEKGPTERDGA